MKNKIIELHLEELNEFEKSSTNGGFVAIAATALGVMCGIGFLAYGAGYLYGSLKCNNVAYKIPVTPVTGAAIAI